MTSIKIKNVLIENNKKYDISFFDTNVPIIEFSKKVGKLYTIMIIDQDAPSRKNPIYKYWLHLLIVNTNDTIMHYMPPNPPKGSGEHRYHLLIFEQASLHSLAPSSRVPHSSIEQASLHSLEQTHKINTSITTRSNFDIDEFIKSNNLILLSDIKFITEKY